MDLRLSADPYESFRIFQGRILEQYLAMSTEFDFLVVDANKAVETQQAVIRQLVANKIDLTKFKRSGRPVPQYAQPKRVFKSEEVAE
jgi:dTMP kinase